MKAESSEKKRKRLEKLLGDVEKRCEQGASKGREVTRYFETTRDMAGATRELIESADGIPEETTDLLLTRWSVVSELAKQDAWEIAKVKLSNNSTMLATATTSGVASRELETRLWSGDTATITVKAQKLNEVFERESKKAEVEALLRELGLDLPAETGKKSALHLLQDAHDAYTQPSSSGNPVSTSLMPMRECINAAIGALLRRRPTQVETGSKLQEKVSSIAAQLGKDDRQLQLKTAGEELKIVMDRDLSGAKQARIERIEWRSRLHRSTTLLFILLDGIDAGKFKAT